jgi:hypothetical protein
LLTAAPFPGNGRAVANAIPPNVRTSDSQDNLQHDAQRSRNVRVTVRATDNATTSETSRKMARRNFVVTISTMTPKKYEHITINAQP